MKSGKNWPCTKVGEMGGEGDGAEGGAEGGDTAD